MLKVSTSKPQAYFYAKFAIAEGSNQLSFRTRNFGNYTFFKVTAITGGRGCQAFDSCT